MRIYNKKPGAKKKKKTPEQLEAERIKRNAYQREYQRKKKAAKQLAAKKAAQKLARQQRKSNPGGGLPAKTAVFEDNFNPDKTIEPSKDDIKKAMLQLELEAETDEQDEESLSEMGFSKAMLQDMRAVYKELGGREKLLSYVSTGDAQFVNLIKELIKVETSLITAKLRRNINSKDNGNGRRNFFVVLKGLHDPTAALDDPKNENIDLAQIERALNPNSVNDSIYEETVLGKDDPPEQLSGSVLDEEALPEAGNDVIDTGSDVEEDPLAVNVDPLAINDDPLAVGAL